MCLSPFALAQEYSVKDKKAIRLYEEALSLLNQRQNALALQTLESLHQTTPAFIEAWLLAYETSYEMRSYDEAERFLGEAMQRDPSFYPNGYFFLGLMQMNRGAYAEAQSNLHQAQKFSSSNPQMVDYIKRNLINCDFALEAIKSPVPFEPENLGSAVNSREPEYYPCITADNGYLLFTRLVPERTAPNGRQEDFYISRSKDGGKSWEPAKPLYSVNTPMNEGAPTMSADGRLLVFTACELMGEYGPGRDGFGSCDLFYAVRVGDNWSQPRNLGESINSAHWETQPSLSADGRTLFFVRGRHTREGIQNQDIYVSRRNASGTWSRAQSLSPNVNTPYREESVFAHPDGRTLYFSSEGYPGMGGLDIYVTRLQADSTWSTPENLGYPINTHNDENSLMVEAGGKRAYFGSNRVGGLGDLDLYRFDLPEKSRPVEVLFTAGTVFDRTTKKPVQAEFELVDLETGNVVVQNLSDAKSGNFLVTLPKGRQYALSAEADGYLFYSATVNLREGSDQVGQSIEVPMAPIKAGEKFVLRNIFFDTDKSDLKAESFSELSRVVRLLHENPEVRLEVGGHTDSEGDAAYNQKLSESRANEVMRYLINQGIDSSRLTSRGYGENAPVTTNETAEGRAQNRRTELTVL